MPKNTTPIKPQQTPARRQSGTAVAALSMAIADRSGKTIQLLPAGEFSAVDGRPANMSAAQHWVLDADNANELIAAAAARSNAAVIDYEHQTLLKEKNGQPAPAAGWFKQLEYREGVGLFANDVEWTPAAAKAIADGEYRYISPVIRFQPDTGRVTGLIMAALTNYAGIDGMQAASLTALSSHFFNEDDAITNEENTMKTLLALLFANLGLDANANEEQAIAALRAHTAKVSQDAAALTNLTGQVASLQAAQPDPNKYVPIDVVKTLQTSLTNLQSSLNEKEVDQVLEAARAAGKVLPAMEAHLRTMGKQDLASLNAFIASLPALAALQGTQTGGKTPGQGDAALSSEQLAICHAMGLSADEYKKSLAVA